MAGTLQELYQTPEDLQGPVQPALSTPTVSPSSPSFAQPVLGQGTYESQVPFQPSWWEKLVNPSGARDAYLFKAQRYNAGQANLGAARASTEANLFKAIQAAPPGERKPLVGVLGRYYKSQGFEMDPAVGDLLNKADEEDLKAAQMAVKLLATQFPEANAEEITKYLVSNPKGIAQFFQLYANTRKQLAEARDKETRAKFLEGASGALQGLDEPLPGPQASPQAPLTAPLRPTTGATGTTETPGSFHPFYHTPEGQAVRQFVVQRAKALGIDPVIAQSLIHQESGGWNPEAQSPTGVVGLAQVTNDTGRKYGQTPETRKNPYVSANAGLTYLADLTKKNGGDIDKALGAYNGGSDPNFVQNVYKHAPLYGGLPRPQTQSVEQGASDQERGTIDLYNRKAAAIQQRINALTRGAGDPAIKAIIDTLEATKKSYLEQSKRIEDRFAGQPSQDIKDAAVDLFPATPWVNLTPAQKQAAIAHAPNLAGNRARTVEEATLEPRRAISAAQGLAAKELEGLTAEERRSLYEVTDRGPVRINPLMTKADLLKARKDGKQFVNLSDLPETAKEKYKALVVVNDTVNDLIPRVQTPVVVAEIGNIVSNPQAFLDRLAAQGGKDLDPEVVKVRAGLSRLAANLQRYYAGTAQTSNEIKNLAPVLAHIEDPTPLALKSKLEALQEGVQREYTSSQGFDTEAGYYVPPLKNGQRPITNQAPPEAPIPKTDQGAAPGSPASKLADKMKNKGGAK